MKSCLSIDLGISIQVEEEMTNKREQRCNKNQNFPFELRQDIISKHKSSKNQIKEKILADMKGRHKQRPVFYAGTWNLVWIITLALSKKGKQRHSLMEHTANISQNTLPAYLIFFGILFTYIQDSDFSRVVAADSIFFRLSQGSSSINKSTASVSALTISSIESDCELLLFSIFYRNLYKRRHAKKLIQHVSRPINKAGVIPYYSLIKGVPTAFMIQPIQGKMKIIPAEWLIHVEARFPWIIQRTQAPLHSRIRPIRSPKKELVNKFGPKTVTRIWPLSIEMAPTSKIF